jgi:hypothetical protein
VSEDSELGYPAQFPFDLESSHELSLFEEEVLMAFYSRSWAKIAKLEYYFSEQIIRMKQ